MHKIWSDSINQNRRPKEKEKQCCGHKIEMGYISSQCRIGSQGEAHRGYTRHIDLLSFKPHFLSAASASASDHISPFYSGWLPEVTSEDKWEDGDLEAKYQEILTGAGCFTVHRSLCQSSVGWDQITKTIKGCEALRGGPVVNIVCFLCRGRMFNPWSGKFRMS